MTKNLIVPTLCRQCKRHRRNPLVDKTLIVPDRPRTVLFKSLKAALYLPKQPLVAQPHPALWSFLNGYIYVHQNSDPFHIRDSCYMMFNILLILYRPQTERLTELTAFIMACPVHNNLLSPALFSQKCYRFFYLYQVSFLGFLGDQKLVLCGMILVLCKLPFQNMKHLLSFYLNVNKTPLGSLQERYTSQVQSKMFFSQNDFIIYVHLTNTTLFNISISRAQIYHLFALKTLIKFKNNIYKQPMIQSNLTKMH